MTAFSLATSILSTCDLKLTKSDFVAKLDVSALVALLRSTFVAELDRPN